MNHDRTQFVSVDTTTMEWSDSPSPSVTRKRCFLDGDSEKGAVTSVVRYAPESSFPEHVHGAGEEIFVLEGVFSDEFGDFSAGTFILNPPGSAHAPGSAPGCRIFVRLRQYSGAETVNVDTTNDALWTTHPEYAGVTTCAFWSDDSVSYHGVRLAPGAALPSVPINHGEEIFVVSGSFSDEYGEHSAETWLRYPAGSSHSPRTDNECEWVVRKLLDQ